MKVTIKIEGLDATMKDLETTVSQFQSFVANTFKSEVTPRTPIDTGRARRGWQIRQQGSGPSIENRVPYIERLERGYSRQAPAGFVKQAVAATVNKAKRTLK